MIRYKDFPSGKRKLYRLSKIVHITWIWGLTDTGGQVTVLGRKFDTKTGYFFVSLLKRGAWDMLKKGIFKGNVQNLYQGSRASFVEIVVYYN